MQYTYDQAGNRTGRSRGTMVRDEGLFQYPANDTTLLRDWWLPEQDNATSVISPWAPVTEKSSVFRKSLAEKIAYEEAQLAEIMALKPVPSHRSRDNNNYDVGAIPLEYGLSPIGARTYSVPISTAPDIKYAPSLSLVYNSQGGHGYGGYGWDIGGISEIRLASKSLYYDGQIVPASALDTAAVFSLDGIRLVQNDDIATSGSYPLVSARGHILVSPHKNSEGFLDTFTVLYPNGVIAVYGTTESVAFQMPSYPIASSTNLDGERIEYDYNVDYQDGNHTLTAVRYGFNSGGTADAMIQFTSTAQMSYSYYAGKKVRRSPLLTQIVSKEFNNNLYTYGLQYETVFGASLLSSISLSNAEGRQLPPLSFTYGNTANPHSGPDSIRVTHSYILDEPLVHNADYIARRGKFIKGNYNDGIVAYADLPTYERVSNNVFACSYPLNYPIQYVASLEDESILSYHNITNSGFQTAEAVDVDGDGVDELVEVYCIFTSSSYSNYKIIIRSCNDDGEFELTSTHFVMIPGCITYNYHYSPYLRTYRWGDFLGNGKTQLLVITYSDNGYGCDQTPFSYLIDLDSGQNLFGQHVFSLASSEDYKVVCMDVDGDSRTELCYATASGLKKYRCTGTSFVLEDTYSNITSSFLNSDKISFTDMNADGYIDIVKAPSSGITWMVMENTGTRFKAAYYGITSLGSSAKYFCMDINRDGYPDIIRVSGTSMDYILNIDGSSFSSPHSSYSSISNTNGILPANVVEYSSMSSFIKIDGYRLKEYVFTTFAPEQRHLVQSEDSFGKIILNDFVYLPMTALYWTENPTGIDASEGYQLRTLPIYVLKGTKGYLSDDENSLLFLQDSYAWADGVANNRGLGFCGFSKIKTSSSLEHNTLVDVKRFDPQRTGIQVSDYSYYRSEYSRTPYFFSTYSYDGHSTTYGKLSPRLISSVENDNLKGTVKTTSIQYDGFDYPVRVVEQFSVGSGEPLKRFQSTVYNHSNSVQSYVLGTVLSQDILTERDGNTSTKWVERTSLTYDSLHHPLTKVQFVSQDSVTFNIVSKEQWTYDSHGNVLSEKSAPYNSSEYVGNVYAYDASGRHITSSTDAIGLTTSYSGFNIYGNPTVVTDHLGRTSYHSYDSWGNRTKTVNPDNTVDSTATAWGGEEIYQITHTVTGLPTEIRDYDALSREVKRSQKRFNGQWQNTMTFYDSRGHVAYVSLPYTGSTWTYRNKYLYDEFGRRTFIRYASGKLDKWSYNGLSITERKDSIIITRAFNAMGDMAHCTDAAGTITYSLRDDGQASSITAPGGAVTTFAFDSLGRRTSIIDPSAGTRTTSYQWNSNGTSSITSTNNNGSITTGYDKYGRVTTITRPGSFNTSYTYDAYGRLTLKTSTNGTGEEYTYDSYDRVSSAMEYVPDGNWLQRSYSYNNNGQLSSIGYTSQDGYITSENYSYANGHNNVIIKSGGTLILSIQSENEFGQPTAALSGSVSRTYGYTEYGLPTYRKLNNGTLQDFRTDFNPVTGNLESRTRYSGGTPVQETFSYDALGRLVMAGSSGMTYDIKGNILSIGGVGTMSYPFTANPYRIDKMFAADSTVTRPHTQSATYTAFDRPATLSENGLTASFTYNADYDRVKMSVSDGTGTSNKYYIGGRYEREEPSGGNVVERLFLGGDAYSAPMVLQKVGNGAWTPYVIGRDYLGSITHITTTSGLLLAEYSYDAWGRMRDPSTLAVYPAYSEPTLLLGRGYCGHEHLPLFGLINMNARLYDPVLGRFLSPDPYVQAPDFSQNFNRYAYALNNPVKYSDKSGEFFVVDSWLFGFFSGGWDEANKRAKNDLRIWGGLFVTDKNNGTKWQVLELISRFSFQLEQTVFGFIAAQAYNTFGFEGGVDSVEYLHGATVLSTQNDWTAFTLSNFIIGGKNLVAENGNELFQHEYGHYLQSEVLGPLYMSKVAIPSLFSKNTLSSPHHNNPAEQDANIRAFKYFKEYYPEEFDTYNSITGKYSGQWKWSDGSGNDKNAIIGVDWLNYGSKTNQNEIALTKANLQIYWFDIVMALSWKPISTQIIGGVLNAAIYNNSY